MKSRSEGGSPLPQGESGKAEEGARDVEAPISHRRTEREPSACSRRYPADVLIPLIPARLHGWLDDLVVLLYLAGAYVVGLHGVALGAALFGATVHFALARCTDYPQGSFKLLSFRAHAFVELGEGLVVMAAALAPGVAAIPWARPFLLAMGASQLGAFAFSDYGWPPAARPPSAEEGAGGRRAA
jgi:hypothetical protein